MASMCEATTRVLPGAAVIELSGEVDGSAADVLTNAYQTAVGTHARAERRKVVACGLSPHYREIFDITRLSDFIELFPDLDGAVSQLTGPVA
jgi:anti-anti-sigma regulatory factor